MLPPNFEQSYDHGRFDSLAEALLRHATLCIGGEEHRVREIEFYYREREHDDPFAHAHPIQSTAQRWYFHREGSGYRGGTYKGLDLTFGPPEARGGILLRSLQRSCGAWVCGSSTCVEHMLRRTGFSSVAQLDEALGTSSVHAENDWLTLHWSPTPLDAAEIWATARVGLTLKRVLRAPTMLDYIVRPYRFLTHPPSIPKGREHVVLAMHQRGLAFDEIVRQSGSPRAAVLRWIGFYEEGRALPSTAPFEGRALAIADRCRLHGALRARMGAPT